MRTPIIEGRSIEQFIPANLRGLFYKHPMPEYKYAIHDGYDPYGFSTKGLVLYLPLWALKDDGFKSVDAYKHTATVTGATWQPDGRLFDGGTDLIDCGKATPINNLSEFSWLTWVHITTWTSGRRVADKANKVLQLGTVGGNQFVVIIVGAGDDARSDTTDFYSLSTWYLVGVSYSFAGDKKPYIYVNGALANQDQVASGGALSAEATASLILGNRNAGDRGVACTIGEQWLYNRALPAGEQAHNYNCTAWRYS